MFKAELIEIIRNGENSAVEFKQDTLENYKLARELVAFANFEGGMVLFGVEDDGTVCGISRENLEEWVMNICRDKIRPEIIPFFEIVKDVESGKHVAIVRVTRGASVYSLWHNNRDYYYIRVGSQTRDASKEELSRLFQQRNFIHAELIPVSGSSLKDLDLRRLKDYFSRIRKQEVPQDEDCYEWQKLLNNTELMTEEALTHAGLLLFGLNPKRFLRQSGISAAAFPGQEKDYAMREQRGLRGPLTPLVNSMGDIAESGLVEQALEFVRRNTFVTAHLVDGARRQERWTYPEEAVRETVVNALIHRDYMLTNTDIELCIYSNRLEVVSPGRLPNGISPERMKTGVRSTRNELLKDIMRDYGYIENLGMGIPRKIIRCMKEHNNTAPDLIEQGERFTVVLWS